MAPKISIAKEGNEMPRFREGLLANQDFIVTCELVPGRGYTGKSVDQVLRFAEDVKDAPEIHALSLTDNAGGNPALSADVLGMEIQRMGVDLIVHFSCKDMNRNAIESRAYLFQRSGIKNLLVVTGDYPISGFLGLPKPNFDIGSVNTLHFLTRLNEGLEIPFGKKTTTLAKTDLFLGACVSPFKWTEGSSVMQYYQMEKKIRAGAHYFITQLGYDARKWMEVMAYLRNYLKLDIPILGSVYLLSAGAARIMSMGEIPGCYIHPRLLETIQAEAKAEDKGKDDRLRRAAKQISILKGLRFNGAHVEGLNLKYPDVLEILQRAAEIGDNWRDYLLEFNYAPDQPFYLFTGGEQLKEPGGNGDLTFNRTRRKGVWSLTFWLTRYLHWSIFTEGTLGYKFMRGVSKLADKSRFVFRLLAGFERLMKEVLFNCRQCDDCALFQTYYLCPESRCPKGMRVGPCGGSRVNGNCEVFEENKCLWERVYWRAKNRKECEKLRLIIAPRNWELYETSSWVNYFLKRDHSGIDMAIPEKIPGIPVKDPNCE